jgi:hypothetical protein
MATAASMTARAAIATRTTTARNGKSHEEGSREFMGEQCS